MWILYAESGECVNETNIFRTWALLPRVVSFWNFLTDDKFGCRACVNVMHAGQERWVWGARILSTMRDSSPPSRYLYIDLWRCPTTYDVTSAHNVIVFLASLDLGWPLYRHNTQILSLFAQRRRRLSAQVIYRWKLEFLEYNFVADICVYLIVIFRIFVPKRGSRIQWNRRRKQISALKWRAEVIQGQSFYAHCRRIVTLASALNVPKLYAPKWQKRVFVTPLSFDAQLLRNPSSISMNLIPPESRLRGLHFCRADSMRLSSFKFSWRAPKDARSTSRSAYWPFKVIRGRWFSCHLKGLMRLPISDQ